MSIGLLNSPAAAVDDVGVDHRGLHAPVPQELLDRPDVISSHEEMGRERVAEGMADRVLGDAGLARCVVEGSLGRPLVEVMATSFPGGRVAPQARGRKDHCQPHSAAALGYFLDRVRHWHLSGGDSLYWFNGSLTRCNASLDQYNVTLTRFNGSLYWFNGSLYRCNASLYRYNVTLTRCNDSLYWFNGSLYRATLRCTSTTSR